MLMYTCWVDHYCVYAANAYTREGCGEKINECTNKPIKDLLGLKTGTVYDMSMNHSFNSLFSLY